MVHSTLLEGSKCVRRFRQVHDEAVEILAESVPPFHPDTPSFTCIHNVLPALTGEIRGFSIVSGIDVPIGVGICVLVAVSECRLAVGDWPGKRLRRADVEAGR